jgi:hypothetical protein
MARAKQAGEDGGMARLTIGPEGQVTLPAALLAALGVEAGTLSRRAVGGLLLTPSRTT